MGDSNDYSSVLRTSRYKINGVYGRGSWGTVYAGRDNALGIGVAIKVLTPTEEAKEKLRRREMTPFEAIAREGGLIPAAHIVPRSFEIDDDGIPFIVMPPYKRFLDSSLGDNGARLFVKNGSLGKETASKYLTDIASGIEEMHKTRKRAHADIKPDNIAVGDNGSLLLNDLGNATLTSLDWAERISPRDNMGAWYTRAPELFLDDSHPERSSDVWSFGALAYRLITGKYPLEDELTNVHDPKRYIESLGQDGLDAVIQRKVRKEIKDRRMRGLIGNSLQANPGLRISSEDLVERVENATQGTLLRDVGRFMKKFSIAAGVVGALSAAGYFMVTAEPRAVPVPPKVSGILHLSDYGVNGEKRIYDIEEPRSLPPTVEGALVGAHPRYSRAASRDMSVAFLVDAHRSALSATRGWHHITDYQKDNFWEHATEEDKKSKLILPHLNGGDQKNTYDLFLMPARSLEATIEMINRAKDGGIDATPPVYNPREAIVDDKIATFEGHIDLEDLITISRYGSVAVQNAKNRANSEFFYDYIEFFPEKERDFMKMWLAYIHDGLARK